ILAAYPDLQREDIAEALHYAAEAVRERGLPLTVPGNFLWTTLYRRSSQSDCGKPGTTPSTCVITHCNPLRTRKFLSALRTKPEFSYRPILISAPFSR